MGVCLRRVADPTNRDQLSPSQCRWSPAYNDDALGLGRCATGSVQYCQRLQHCPQDTATSIDTAEFGDLDPMLLLREGDVVVNLFPNSVADYRSQKWSVPRSLGLVTPVACIMGGIQAALIVALRIAKDRDVHWPLTLMAVLSAVLLAAGVLRHYVDIYVHRTVRGISFLFVGLDAAGDLFSLLSVLFQRELDILGLVIYGTELVLWLGIFACGGYYNLVPWLKSNVKRGEAASTVCSSRMNGRQSGPAAATTEPIALHSLPSSTSVFRTPSGELDIIRRHRSTGSRGSGCP